MIIVVEEAVAKGWSLLTKKILKLCAFSLVPIKLEKEILNIKNEKEFITTTCYYPPSFIKKVDEVAGNF